MSELGVLEVSDLRDAGGRDQLIRQLREDGLATFGGVADRAALVDAAGWRLAFRLPSRPAPQARQRKRAPPAWELAGHGPE